MAVVGTVMFLFLGILYAWSIFRVELEKLFPFSAAQMSLTFSIAVAFFCIGGFSAGRLIQRTSASVLLRISAALVLVGFCAIALMRAFEDAALAVLYICYGVVAAFGVGIAYNVGLGNIAPWFPKHIGLVSGILMMGFGFSGIVFSLILDVLCPIVGIFGIFVIFGIGMALAIFAASFFVRRPKGAAGEKTGELPDEGSCTPRQMVSKLGFWIYFLWCVLNVASGLLIINSSANISIFYGGTASLGMVISIFNGIGRPAAGWIADRVGKFSGMLMLNTAIILSALALIATSFGGGRALMVLGLVIIGTSYGGGGSMTSKVVNADYGPKYYAANHSVMNMSGAIAGFAGPYISGLLLDSAGGDYRPTFFMLLAIGIVEIALIFVLKTVLKLEKKK